MRNFFEHQDRARRNTRWLVLLMVLGVLAMGGAVYAMLLLFMRHWPWASAAGTATGWLPRPDLLLGAVGGTAALVGLASGARMLALRGGGSQIAEMLGGRLISGSPRDVLERRLLNVVEEMAIASGVPVPQVFVLDGEDGINAFAAGLAIGDAVVAVTRGGLEKLTREELQGVIAHEFSHVLNGDSSLNIRLMGIVFGMLCLALFGRLLMRVSTTPGRIRSRAGRDNSPTAVIFVVGLGVFLIGSIGELFGKLIKAAISRQREYLADASAVQFTRNPSGIGGALKKIGGFSRGARIHSGRAEEASHFFFGDIHTSVFDLAVLATHPPLAERIRRIDPRFDGQYPQVADGIAEPETAGAVGFAGAASGAARSYRAPEAVVASVGTTGPEALDRGRELLAQLPPALHAAAQSPFSACAIVYALLLADDPAVAQAQRAQIDALSGRPLHAEMGRCHSLVKGLPRSERLSLVIVLAPALRALSVEQRGAFARTVSALIDADRAVSIFEYVLAETLRRRLAAERPAQRSARVRHKALKAVRAELELLLSLLAHAGDREGGGAARALGAAAAQLPGVALSLLPRSERLLTALSPALDELRALTPELRARLIDACAHAVLADRRVNDDEATLLRAVCDALECPLPPLPVAS